LSRTLRIVAILALTVVAFGTLLGETRATDTQGKVSAAVLDATANGQQTSFVIYLKDQADLSAASSITNEDARGLYVYNTLRAQAASTQGPIQDLLASHGVSYRSFWAVNMIVADGNRDVVEALATRSDVKAIESDEGVDAIQGEDGPETTDEGNAVEAIETGINNVKGPSLWSLGFTGQGIVVANQDTGMRWTHAALRTRYRG